MKYYLKAYKNYAVFEGRASLVEFWYFFLFNIVLSVSAVIIDNLLGIESKGLLGQGLIFEIYSIIVFIPGIAVSIRRLHDSRKSGWYILIVIVPIIGIIGFFLLTAVDGSPGKNEYGENPKESNKF
jgi:uncharacterized membrane protein YhaH (DUF805 family)